MHANFSQLLIKDNFTAHQCTEHNLISWIDEPLASVLHMNPSVATVAGTSNSMITMSAAAGPSNM